MAKLIFSQCEKLASLHRSVFRDHFVKLLWHLCIIRSYSLFGSHLMSKYFEYFGIYSFLPWLLLILAVIMKVLAQYCISLLDSILWVELFHILLNF